MKNIVLPVSGIILAGLLVACSPAQESSLTTAENTPEAQFNPETMSEEQFKALGLELRRMVGTPTASSPDQCRVVAMGHKPCGGPERYLMYSTQVLNGDKEAEFLKKLQRYNQLSKQFSDNAGMVSDCQMLPEPAVVVRNGFCMPAEKAEM